MDYFRVAQGNMVLGMHLEYGGQITQSLGTLSDDILVNRFVLQDHVAHLPS